MSQPQIHLGAPTLVGEIFNGSTLAHVGFDPDSGSIRSEDAYPIKIDAVFHHGADYFSQDPDAKHARLDVSSVLKDKSGAAIRCHYTGILNVTGPVGKILGGAADAATTDFGDACET